MRRKALWQRSRCSRYRAGVVSSPVQLPAYPSISSTAFHNRSPAARDVDYLYVERQLKNIAASISLALAEYRGPQRFHNHFRHDPHDYETLHPVYEPPLPTLVRVCEESLARCNTMVGIRERPLVRLRNNLEHCLRNFLHACE